MHWSKVLDSDLDLCFANFGGNSALLCRVHTLTHNSSLVGCRYLAHPTSNMSNTAATPMGKGRLALALEAAEKIWQGTYDRVMLLEQLKKDIAAAEDFDTAGRIKEELRKVYALLISFNESNIQMDKAAQKDDYMEAARLKAERDETMAAAITALAEVEQQFAGNAMPSLQSPPPPPPYERSYRSHHKQ